MQTNFLLFVYFFYFFFDDARFACPKPCPLLQKSSTARVVSLQLQARSEVGKRYGGLPRHNESALSLEPFGRPTRQFCVRRAQSFIWTLSPRCATWCG